MTAEWPDIEPASSRLLVQCLENGHYPS